MVWNQFHNRCFLGVEQQSEGTVGVAVYSDDILAICTELCIVVGDSDRISPDCYTSPREMGLRWKVEIQGIGGRLLPCEHIEICVA
jgi:hypothetical protein